MTSIESDEEVMFRPFWCDKCKKYFNYRASCDCKKSDESKARTTTAAFRKSDIRGQTEASSTMETTSPENASVTPERASHEDSTAQSTINNKDANGMTSFFAKITEPDETYRRDKLWILNSLIFQLGADPLTTIDNYKTCLHYAVEHKLRVSRSKF